LAGKLWQKVLFADLLWEKNTIEWLTNSTDKSSERACRWTCWATPWNKCLSSGLKPAWLAT
jgi:hypothetical protein